MYFKRTPRILSYLFRNALFKGPENAIYFTFDDGPDPESTIELLSLLKKYNIKATFFCLGSQVQKHPQLFHQIIKEGHSVGHHGYDHISGWQSSHNTYVNNAHKAANIIKSHLYRPPYGRMKWWQYRRLSKIYKIVLWDVMLGDFDPSVSEEKMFETYTKYITKGSIIVLHDKPECLNKIEYLFSRMDKTLDFKSLS